ncbi:hypothetical protein [Brachybacterium kimchii]|uniref:RNase H type-1 domain-containing protein n=1 Tax=Brachybacterium kimchii TaxID=2942909 RepID=A0ABY4NAQ5_9MICO|nr:hypothetical protein [Brachybacterium kimchii]UQN30454.1 hypothetical protein M4486_03690 [Brachybacterium kimchii]
MHPPGPEQPLNYRDNLNAVLEEILADGEGGHIVLLTDDPTALAHAEEIENATGLYVLRPFDGSSERELMRMKRASSLLTHEVIVASDASYRSARRTASVAVALDGAVARVRTRRALRTPLHIAELTGILQGNAIHLEGPRQRTRTIYSDSRAAIRLAQKVADASADEIARLVLSSGAPSPYGGLQPWIMRHAQDLGRDLAEGVTRVRWVRAHCESPEHVQDHLNIIADQIAQLLTRRGASGEQDPAVREASRELITARFPQVRDVVMERPEGAQSSR